MKLNAFTSNTWLSRLRVRRLLVLPLLLVLLTAGIPLEAKSRINYVIVKTTTGKRISGKLLRYRPRPATLLVQKNSGVGEQIALEEIDTVMIEKKRSKLLTIGATALVGAALAGLAASTRDWDPEGESLFGEFPQIALATIGGGTAGLVLGRGLANMKRDRRYHTYSVRGISLKERRKLIRRLRKSAYYSY